MVPHVGSYWGPFFLPFKPLVPGSSPGASTKIKELRRCLLNGLGNELISGRSYRKTAHAHATVRGSKEHS